MEANDLATGAADPNTCYQEYAIGHKGLQSIYWPVQTVERMDNEGMDNLLQPKNGAEKTSPQTS